MRNPHFDDGIVVWADEYSGEYVAPDTGYSEQFDLQWRLALEGNPEYYDYAGVNIDDNSVSDRIYEWTGKHPKGPRFQGLSSLRALDHPLDPEIILGKDCIDVGCGFGRWTKLMQALGARSVLSIDMSRSALESVRRFNENVQEVDIMRIPSHHSELVGRFDFANFWGVAMCTHDPAKAFNAAASTVKDGGSLYLMVYAPEGMHGTEVVNRQRMAFNRLQTVNERLKYVDHVHNREWDWSYPLTTNIRNIGARVLRRPKSSKIGILDMLEPFYNWVIPLDVVYGWMKKSGFQKVTHLNEFEKPACAYHVLGEKKLQAPAS
jgi:SAM-dependent methyltransferase